VVLYTTVPIVKRKIEHKFLLQLLKVLCSLLPTTLRN